jgi:hypothetical protein
VGDERVIKGKHDRAGIVGEGAGGGGVAFELRGVLGALGGGEGGEGSGVEFGGFEVDDPEVRVAGG